VKIGKAIQRVAGVPPVEATESRRGKGKKGQCSIFTTYLNYQFLVALLKVSNLSTNGKTG
jgi:hypothetical protein